MAKKQAGAGKHPFLSPPPELYILTGTDTSLAQALVDLPAAALQKHHTLKKSHDEDDQREMATGYCQ